MRSRATLRSRLQRWLNPAAVITPAPADPTLRGWGAETLELIDHWFAQPDQLYRNEITIDEPRPTKTRALLVAGVQLAALVAATRGDPRRYARQLKRYADAIERYRVEANGISGYDVLPGRKPLDRYYDENAWAVRAFAGGSVAGAP